jgi:hypothetical protein
MKITRYGNRKLYNSATASYVSMLELSDLVANGGQIEVVCDRTGRDLTLLTLTRLLYERLKAYCIFDPLDGPEKLDSKNVSDLIALIPSVKSEEK